MSNWTDKDFETYTQSDWELIKSVKELTDINLGNPAVLESANEIALAVFGMLCVRLHEKGGEGVDGLGMALQEYTGTVLGYSKGGENDGWADGTNTQNRLTNLYVSAKRNSTKDRKITRMHSSMLLEIMAISLL
jgi:hypothetical protein